MSDGTSAPGSPPHPTLAGEEASATRRALRRVLITLCVTEIISWGALYYAFPVMLTRLTATTGWSTETATGAFSMGLVISALAGVPVGRLLDRHGPRLVMSTGSILGVAALLAVAVAPTLPWFFAAWVLIGLAQSALLYPPAFSALTRWYGPYRVYALTTLSLAAGLSSTVFAPLTAALVDWLDWRTAYVVLAGILGAVTIPLHILGLSLAWPAEERHHPLEPTARDVHTVLRDQVFSFLVVAMALAAFGMYAANINLVPLLTSQGTSNTLAALALGLSGAGQVLGRLSYPMLTRRTTPRTRTVTVLAAGGVTVALLAVVSHFMAALLAAAILAGAIRGIYTLLQATAVSDRWGTSRFPTINGIFSAPTTIAIAIAPGGGALLAGWLGSYPTAFYVLAILVLVGAVTAIRT